MKLATKPAVPGIRGHNPAYGRIMTPEIPHHAPARQVWRSSARPFAGATSGSLGEDILLARHGDRILRLRQDHRGGQTVASLRDGTMDAAPNRIEGGVLALRPGERAEHHRPRSDRPFLIRPHRGPSRRAHWPTRAIWTTPGGVSEHLRPLDGTPANGYDELIPRRPAWQCARWQSPFPKNCTT